MSLLEDIRHHLQNPDSGVTNNPVRQASRFAFYNRIGSRIYRNRIKQGVPYDKPALRMRRIGTIPYNDLAGQPDCSVAIVEFFLRGYDIALLESLGEHLRLMFDTYRGSLGVNGFLAGCTQERGGDETPQQPKDGSGNFVQGYSIDFRMTYKQPTATGAV